MKHLVTLSLLMTFAQVSWARTTSETGRGSASGFCTPEAGYFCIDNVKRDAERSATNQASFSCQLHGGRARSYTAMCSSSCVPSIIGPNEPPMAVYCSSTCTLDCEIED